MENKYKFHKLYILLVILALGITGYGQEDSQYTQYMYNPLSINPAYAGSRGALSMNGLYRAQWVGVDGTPKTFLLSAHSPIGIQNVVGLGFSFQNDEHGPVQENYVTADFSYTLKLSNTLNIALGLKGGINLLNVDLVGLDTADFGDSSFSQNINNRVSPTIGVGLFLYNLDKWYIGLSAPNFIETTHNNSTVSSTTTETLHGYLTGGYVFNLNSNLQLKPTFTLKGVNGAPLALDFSLNALIYEKFTLGAAYRLDAAVSGLAAYQINKNIMIGYAYDYDITDFQNFNSGSHEIFLRYEVFNKSSRMLSPRFF